MNVEKVRVLKTLKFGEIVFQEGKVLTKPFPPEILRELTTNSGTLEAIDAEPPPPVVKNPVETPEPPKDETPQPKAKKPKKLVPRGK